MVRSGLRSIRHFLTDLLKGSAHIAYHVTIVLFGAAFAFSLPFTAAFAAKKVLAYWSFVGNDKVFLVSLEIVSAVLLILVVNHLRNSWNDRRVSRMARAAGLVLVSPTARPGSRRRIKRLKEKQGLARDVMAIALTGYATFVDEKGELNQVLANCREAKIMLLHPDGEGARIQSRRIGADESSDLVRKRIWTSIDFLKQLRLSHRNVRLKLYDETPLLRMTILGDYLWIQHHHFGLNAGEAPKYVFKHNQDHSSLFVLFYRYFLARWHDVRSPEYDLDRDELVYRDPSGGEIRREAFMESPLLILPDEQPRAMGSSSR